MYGVKFKIRSDHKILITVLRPNRGNRFSSRITRWVDRLLPFELEVSHVAERTLGMVDYLSRHPTELQGAAIKAETLSNEWFTINSVTSLNDVSEQRSDKRSNERATQAGEKCERKQYRQSHRSGKIKTTNQNAGQAKFAGI